MLYKTKKYYDFLEIFERSCDCPVCVMVNDWRKSFIETFLYECVNDRSMRRKIRENGGFCKSHASSMMKAGDPLGHAVIYTALIEEYLAKPDKKMKKGCLLCDLENEQDDISSKAFLDFFRESEEFVESFSKNSTCLCRPHLLSLKKLTRKDKKLIEKLNKVQSENLKNAKANLDEIIRKHDYRFKDESLTEEENIAWKRAVKLMTGILE